MKYFTGEEVRVGDKVQMDNNCFGVVVCSIDTDEYSAEHPREQWSYLKVGVMFDTDWGGLIYYTEADEDLVLVRARSFLTTARCSDEAQISVAFTESCG